MRAGRQRERLASGIAPGLGDLALGVAGGRRPRPAARRSRSAWAAPSGSAARASRARPARAAARWRTGRACRRGRPSTPRPSAPPHAARRRRARSIPAGLSYEEDAVGDGGRGSSQLLRRPRRAGTRPARASPASVEKPAAWRWPPPPWARAIARDVDAVVGGAQRHLARPCSPSPRRSRTSAGDRGALDRAQVVDDALGVALLGAGRARSPRRVRCGERQQPVVVALDVGEPARQQLELAVRDALVEAPVDLVHVDAGLDQLGGHLRARAGRCSRT